MFRNRKPVVALLVSMALVVSACGNEVASEETTTTQSVVETTTTVAETTTTSVATTTTVQSGFPVTVESGGVTTTLESPPTAIVSLSPTATEMLFAIGAGSNVVAVDEYSYYPEETPVTELSGFTPNLEAIVAYGPDLVVVGGDIDGIVASLEGVGIPTLVLPAATVIEDAYQQIRVLGEITGFVDDAESLASAMQAEIEGLVAEAEIPVEPLTYYHELGSDGGGAFYSVTSSTFIGEVFAAFGLENIADPADTDGFGYPVLSVEYIIEADPDLIFFTNCCGDTPETIAARPGWDSISAVSSGSLYELDDDLASRWGPRLVEFFRLVADALSSRGGG